jgi:hypothetical protein
MPKISSTRKRLWLQRADRRVDVGHGFIKLQRFLKLEAKKRKAFLPTGKKCLSNFLFI